ncbi:MAG: hypothetical protein EA378_00195 [Phycisphaerales bacterium]|nr:MAG: hypothetical protein EA378_00195 [Phycisphaerales bacterium]
MASARLSSVRASVSRITHGLGVPTVGVAELTRALGLDKKLAWQISNLLSERDPLRSARFIPGPQPLKRFCEAARARGVAPEVITQAQSDIRDFQRFVTRHLGDEETFEEIVACHRGSGDDSVSVRMRKQLFQANSSLLRGRAHAIVRTAVFTLDEAGTGISFAIVRGLVGLLRYSDGRPWRLSSVRATEGPNPRLGMHLNPLPGIARQDGEVPIWKEFSRGVGLDGYRTETPDGYIEDWVPASPVGLSGKMDCVTAECGELPNWRYRSPTEPYHSITSPVQTPCEWIVMDQFIDERIWGEVKPESILLTDVRQGPERPWHARPEDRLDFAPEVESLGRGIDAVHCVQVPMVSELTRAMFHQLGVEAERYMHFRLMLQYPPVPSRVGMAHELPEAPGC